MLRISCAQQIRIARGVAHTLVTSKAMSPAQKETDAPINDEYKQKHDLSSRACSPNDWTSQMTSWNNIPTAMAHII
jgi:hypothetical protein